MHKGRLEAFSDGVLAIIITIMVLELKVPHGALFSDLQSLIPVFLSYILSFIYVGIYWNNHHHMFHAVKEISGRILWSNLHLLFWLSLVPFVTTWAGENHFESAPVALYGFVLFGCSIAYWILVNAIIAHQGNDGLLTRAVGKDTKGKVSTLIYAIAMPLAYVSPWISLAGYVLVACIWFIPDSRIEKKMNAGH